MEKFKQSNMDGQDGDKLNWATIDEIKANKKAELQGKPLPYGDKKINPMFDNDFEEKFILEEVKEELKKEGWKEDDTK